jgi:DNA-directed RNA polymerase specialized sigma24 family protein
VDEHDFLAEGFEENLILAYWMLGSLSEADEAVQKAWLRLGRSGAGGIVNWVGG